MVAEDAANSDLVRFHSRFQRDVYRYYSRRPRGASRSIRHALLRFRLAVRGGVIKLTQLSRFLSRADVKDKVECYLRISVQDKDFLEKLAFALRLSQAEVLRMALEWFMEATGMHSPRAVFLPAFRRWHHRRPKPVPYTMRFSFWATGRLLEWQIPPEPAISRAYALIGNPDSSRFSKKNVWQYRDI